ncbi:MAG TPA: SpoIIE family protein phosphatase [Phycisphaerae bacterium]|nr:SpoIIE family protein phosphatase [Phycisphaerales bacterium]HRX86722.1 SpoIIE family protein phosphatase [Phycisphaerae bacterium]
MARVVEARTLTDRPEPSAHEARSARRLRLVGDQMASARAGLNRELKRVAEIQRSFLPEALPRIPGFDVAAYYQPSALAGGDYFDIVPLAKDRWGLVMADVAGHGVSATVIMAVMRALVHAHLPHTRYLPACAFLEFINEQMMGAYTANGRFVTVWAAVLDPVTRRLTYASAGHNPPRLMRAGRVMALDAVGGLPIGIDGAAAYEECTVTLEAGDLLVVYTDGITEAMSAVDGCRAFFATEGLDRALLAAGEAGAEECMRRVTTAVDEFTGMRVPADDQTILVVRVEQGAAEACSG